jgi:hypothetical protein
MWPFICSILIVIVPVCITLFLAENQLWAKCSPHPRIKEIMTTYGPACLFWTLISIVAVQWWLNCNSPVCCLPPSPSHEEYHSSISECDVRLFAITMPVVFATASIYLFTIGRVIWQMIARRRAKDTLDWREGKPRLNPTRDDLYRD